MLAYVYYSTYSACTLASSPGKMSQSALFAGTTIDVPKRRRGILDTFLNAKLRQERERERVYAQYHASPLAWVLRHVCLVRAGAKISQFCARSPGAAPADRPDNHLFFAIFNL